MKKFSLVILLILIFTLEANPFTLEFPVLYRDPRIMSMGGVNVAIGGYSSSIFYNPAGLSNINPESGFEVDLIGANLSYSKDGLSFYNEMTTASATGNPQEVNRVLDKYRGKDLFVELNSFPSISRNFGRLAFAVGLVGVARMNAMVHQGLGPSGLVTINGGYIFGPAIGISMSPNSRLSLGGSIKTLKTKWMNEDLSAVDLINSDGNLENYMKEDNSTTVDIGLIFRPPYLVAGFKPSIGISYTNIGSIRAGDSLFIPPTVNGGVSLSKKFSRSFLNSLIFGLDITDIGGAFPQDKDLGKRVNLGFEVGFYRSKLFDLIFRAGSHQGYLTGGIELRALILRLTFATYGEEIGAYSGQQESRRYMISAFVSW